MSETYFGKTAQTILQHLRTNPKTVLSLDEVCAAVECLPSEVRIELKILDMVGLIEHQRSVGGSETCRLAPR